MIGNGVLYHFALPPRPSTQTFMLLFGKNTSGVLDNVLCLRLTTLSTISLLRLNFIIKNQLVKDLAFHF